MLDCLTIQPVFFLPPVPTLLINGAVGIGTGWSTAIPMHDPIEVIESTRAAVISGSATPLEPKVTGWTGKTLLDHEDGVIRQVLYVGTFEIVDYGTDQFRLIVTELPPSFSVNQHKTQWISMLGPEKANCLVSTQSESTNDQIREIYEIDLPLAFEWFYKMGDTSMARKRSITPDNHETLSRGAQVGN